MTLSSGDGNPDKGVPVVNLDADQEASLRGLMPDFEPPKGGDDKSKAQKESSAQAVQMVGGFYAVVFGLLASRLGDHWALKDDEVAALAVPTVGVIEKYYPDAQMGVEAALVVSVVMVVVPRLMVKPPIEGETENGDKSKHVAPQPE